VVVVDGTFLQSAALRGAWDVVIWLATGIPEAERRAVGRDAELFGGEDEARVAYRTRYHAACRLYLAEVHPQEAADVVVLNDDLDAPVLTIRSGERRDRSTRHRLSRWPVLRSATVRCRALRLGQPFRPELATLSTMCRCAMVNRISTGTAAITAPAITTP
jgi:hypothetical protein